MAQSAWATSYSYVVAFLAAFYVLTNLAQWVRLSRLRRGDASEAEQENARGLALGAMPLVVVFVALFVLDRAVSPNSFPPLALASLGDWLTFVVFVGGLLVMVGNLVVEVGRLIATRPRPMDSVDAAELAGPQIKR